MTPEGIGVAVATLVDLSKSIAALKVLRSAGDFAVAKASAYHLG